MSSNNNNDFNVDALLKSLFPPETLEGLFDRRLKELNLTPTNALEVIDIEYRALNAILSGTGKRVDFSGFIKLSNFLQLPAEKVFALYLEAMENSSNPGYSKDKVSFIKENFDLAALKKAGFIPDITDYETIEFKISQLLGLKDILDYKLPSNCVAFSSGKVQPKNLLNRGLWLNSVVAAFKQIANPYPYYKSDLLKYIPQIRTLSTDVDYGLISVIKNLYKLGITVLYQPPLPSLHLRGATIDINDKPCIVLTDYVGFYSTLWFALMHELYHVLFDFEEIRRNEYHISGGEDNDSSLMNKEGGADDFAREYFLSKEKSKKIKAHITNSKLVKDFAAQNGVHESIVYTFYAFDAGSSNNAAWTRAKKFNPSIQDLLAPISILWKDVKDIKSHIKEMKKTIYN